MAQGTEPPVVVYRPNQRHELGLFRTWAVMARNVVDSRELIWQLFKRDFTAVYRKSFIGVTWVFLMPLLAIVQWVLLKRTNILNPGEMPGGVPYTVYVLVGNSMWLLFANLFLAASKTLTSGKELVMQVRYGHEALLFKQAAQALAHFCIGFMLNVIVLLIFGVVPSWKTVLLPLVALPLFLLGSAAGLMVSMFEVVAVDVSRLATRGLMLLMMLTPVIYVMRDPDKLPKGPSWARMLYHINTWNPLTYLVGSARDIVLYGRLYDASTFALCAAGSAVVFLISWRLFYVSEDRLIERMI